VKFMISAGTLILAVIYARVKVLHVFQPIFSWFGQGMACGNELLDWLLKPIGLLFKIFYRIIQMVLRPILPLLHRSFPQTSGAGHPGLETDCDETKAEKKQPDSSR
jgi:hypothetical protein